MKLCTIDFMAMSNFYKFSKCFLSSAYHGLVRTVWKLASVCGFHCEYCCLDIFFMN